jgi:hypothetical protein
VTLPFLPIAEARSNNLQPLTVPALRRRNPAWTEGTVAKLLGAPDAVMHNPNGGRMRVYYIERVEAAEATPAFAARMAK